MKVLLFKQYVQVPSNACSGRNLFLCALFTFYWAVPPYPPNSQSVTKMYRIKKSYKKHEKEIQIKTK